MSSMILIKSSFSTLLATSVRHHTSFPAPSTERSFRRSCLPPRDDRVCAACPIAILPGKDLLWLYQSRKCLETELLGYVLQYIAVSENYE